jgi:hypothetical protein
MESRELLCLAQALFGAKDSWCNSICAGAMATC